MAGRIGTTVDATAVAQAAGLAPLPRRSVLGRVYDRLTAWFGPGQPQPTMAPPGTPARRYDYPSGYNIRIQPRATEPIGFKELLALADACWQVRGCIETVKDGIEKFTYTIGPKDPKKRKSLATSASPTDPRIKELEDFFAFPDREHSWKSWVREVIEEMCVTDALSIYVRRTAKGTPYALELIDGATITPKIDETGRRPEQGEVAYQQIVKGAVAAEFTAEELYYVPRNPRPRSVYGFGPVEQMLMVINIALRKEVSKLQYWTAGNVPDALCGLPDDWTPEQVEEFQVSWDAYYEGNTDQRRRMKFIPGQIAKNYVPTRNPELKDEEDEWLARIACYFFSVSPLPFIKQGLNRATGQIAQDTALEEGLLPKMEWIKVCVIDRIIAECFGYADLGFFWQEVRAADPLTKAQENAILVAHGVKSVDQWAQELGLDPPGMPHAIWVTGGPPVLIADVIKQSEAAGKTAENPPPPPMIPPGPGGGGGGPEQGRQPPQGGGPGGGKEPARTPPAEKRTGVATARSGRGGAVTALAAATEPVDALAKGTVAALSPKRRRYLAGRQRNARPVLAVQSALGNRLARFLHAEAATVAGQVAAALHLRKAAPDDPEDSPVDEAVDGLDFASWGDALAAPVADSLERVAADGARTALETLGVTVDVFERANEGAIAFARARGAELVGMKWNADGDLIVNPNPKWAITEDTRAMLRADVTRAFEEGLSRADLVDLFEQNYAFSAERADMIARTEISRALIAGNMEGWKASGVVKGKQWLLGSEHDIDDVCNDNADAGVIALEDDFPSGDAEAPAHPNCVCDVVPVLEGAGSAQEE